MVVVVVFVLSFLDADTVLGTVYGKVVELSTGRAREPGIASGTVVMDRITGDAVYPEYVVLRSSRWHRGVMIPWCVERAVVVSPKGNALPIPPQDAVVLKELLDLEYLDASTGRYKGDRILWGFVFSDILLTGLVMGIVCRTVTFIIARRRNGARVEPPSDSGSRHD
ncbi:MAG TPA: hypothetical protein ENJ00_06110 [Phycisphaerales bacterium]|nr:hypothetical protein [Phycisphaerales bacterium]